MEIHYIEDFKNGWFCGSFEPSIIKSKEVEVGYHKYYKGDFSDGHFHKLSKEVNYIIKGKVLILKQDGDCDLIIREGCFFVYEPYEESKVVFLEDTELIIVKTPSAPGDKYYNKPLYGLNTCSKG